MTTFDRHILKRLILSYFLLVCALIVFFIVLHYVEYIDDFFDRGATSREVLGYYRSYIPEIIRLISPLAVFMSAVYLVGRLSQTMQLAALQTSGVSLYRILLAPVLFGLLVTALMFWFNGWVVPRTNSDVLAFEQRFLRDSAGFIDVNDIHRQTSPHGIVSVGFYDRENSVGHRASLHEYDANSRLVFRIDAPRITWVDSLQVWRFENAVARRFDDIGVERIRRVAILDTTMNVLPRDFARTQRDVESMTIPQAAEYVTALKRAGASNLARARVQYATKFAYPLSNLILVLLGAALASVRRRGGQAIQIGLGLVLAFIYLTVLKVLEPFGFAGSISPAVSAWAPHLAFLLATVLYLIRAPK